MQHHTAKYDLYHCKEKCRSDVVTELTALGRCHQLVKLHTTHLHQTLVITRFDRMCEFYMGDLPKAYMEWSTQSTSRKLSKRNECLIMAEDRHW